jgi:hypothetical protein
MQFHSLHHVNVSPLAAIFLRGCKTPIEGSHPIRVATPPFEIVFIPPMR